jgi:hypothetical protein
VLSQLCKTTPKETRKAAIGIDPPEFEAQGSTVLDDIIVTFRVTLREFSFRY